MTNELIPVFVGDIAGTPSNLVDAKPLHQFLKVVTRFNDWIARRIEEYGFVDGEDFYSFLSKSNRGRQGKEYHLSIDMAKELCMVEKTDKGREARKYFIEMERQAHQAQYGLKQLPEPPCITTAQAGELYARVIEIAGESGKIRAAVWSRFQKHFRTNSYKALPADRYEEALAYLEERRREYAEEAGAPPSGAHTLAVPIKLGSGVRTVYLNFEGGDQCAEVERWLTEAGQGGVVSRKLRPDTLVLTEAEWVDRMWKQGRLAVKSGSAGGAA